MPQICDTGQTALLPFWRKACRGFFHLKSPTALARSEPTTLGTRGQHANHYTTEAANQNVYLAPRVSNTASSFCSTYNLLGGHNSSVGIAPLYGLEGPGIESRGRQDFPHPSRPGSTFLIWSYKRLTISTLFFRFWQNTVIIWELQQLVTIAC
jgi:hypothetical protein